MSASRRVPATLAPLLLTAALAGASPAAAQDGERQRLEALEADIEALEREIARQIDRRDDGMAELRTIELSIAETRQALGAVRERVEAQTARRAALETERGQAAERLAAEEAALAEQVRLSYMTGRQELVKLVLSQESAADFGRMLVYYDYLNRHRGDRIEAVDAELERLAALEAESAVVAAELERLAAEREARLATLTAEQAERSRLVAELEAAIEASGGRIEQMRAEQAMLNETIARIERLTEGFPVASDDPFSAQKGQLRWPVDGGPMVRFGDFRDGTETMRWDGVLLEAETGATVRAVYRGRVEFADWLPGMGLLMIIDHGESIYTLYGHNSALLREPGDHVEPGEPVAEAGDSGGRPGAGLYFEIRRDGVPVDPADWMR